LEKHAGKLRRGKKMKVLATSSERHSGQEWKGTGSRPTSGPTHPVFESEKGISAIQGRFRSLLIEEKGAGKPGRRHARRVCWDMTGKSIGEGWNACIVIGLTTAKRRTSAF